MGFTKASIIAGALSALVATPILAQQNERPRMSKECREEVRALCASDGERDRAKRRACVQEKKDSLSEGCAAEINQRMQNRRTQKRSKSGSN